MLECWSVGVLGFVVSEEGKYSSTRTDRILVVYDSIR